MRFKPYTQLLVGAIPRRRPSDLVAGTVGVGKVEKMKSTSVDSGAATEWVHIDDANVGWFKECCLAEVCRLVSVRTMLF